MTIEIHGLDMSTYTRTARMAAEEKGVPHRLVPLAYGEPSHFALHPFGKMPAMVDGDTTVFETLAILQHLDHRYGDRMLFPRDSTEHALALTAISIAIDYGYRAIVHTGTGAKDENLVVAGRVFDWLEQQLATTPFIAGDALSAADLVLAPMLDYHFIDFAADGVFAARPRLHHWFDAMTQRPAFTATTRERA